MHEGSRIVELATLGQQRLVEQQLRQVVELLASLARDRGVAILMVTHDPRFASWTDRVVFLRDGRIVDESAPRFAAADSGVAR